MGIWKRLRRAAALPSGSNGTGPFRTASRDSKEDQDAQSLRNRAGTLLAVLVILALAASALAAGGLDSKHTLLRGFAIVVLSCPPAGCSSGSWSSGRVRCGPNTS